MRIHVMQRLALAVFLLIPAVARGQRSNPQVMETHYYVYKLQTGSAIELETTLNSFFSESRQPATQPNDDLRGKVRVLGDPEGNSILVATNPYLWDRVRQILVELDGATQILVKILITDVSSIDAARLVGGAQFRNAPSTAPAATATGSLQAHQVDDEMSKALTSLGETGKMTILARPFVLAANRRLATIAWTKDGIKTEVANVPQDARPAFVLDFIPALQPDGRIGMRFSIQKSNEPKADAKMVARNGQGNISVESGTSILVSGPSLRNQDGDQNATEWMLVITPSIAPRGPANVANDLPVIPAPPRR